MLYHIAWAIFRCFCFLRLARVTIIGSENIPREGPAILAAKHWGSWDPCYIAIATKRRIRFLASSRGRIRKFVNFFWSLIAAIPIRKGSPDRVALSEAVEALENGELVGLFAIGHRQKRELEPVAQRGAAFIAKKSGINPRIIPVSIISQNANGHLRRRPIQFWVVAFGSPINPADFADVDSLNERISRSIMDLQRGNLNYHGVLP